MILPSLKERISIHIINNSYYTCNSNSYHANTSTPYSTHTKNTHNPPIDPTTIPTYALQSLSIYNFLSILQLYTSSSTPHPPLPPYLSHLSTSASSPPCPPTSNIDICRHPINIQILSLVQHSQNVLSLGTPSSNSITPIECSQPLNSDHLNA